MVKIRVFSIVLLALTSIASPLRSEEARAVEATSFGGAPLYRYEVPVERRAEVYERIAALEAKADKSEDDYETLGYLYIEVGRFQAAIDLYTRGLEAYPASFRLLRHRGHRYLNTRQLAPAIADLERAVELIGDAHGDVVQYRLGGDAFGTYEHWVWYHIGLYHYLQGDHDAAAAAFARCIGTARIDQHLVGAIDWTYNSLIKAGRADEARAVLAQAPDRADIPSSYTYWERVRVYRGELDPETLLDPDKPGAQWDGREITTGYGVATWYASNGQTGRAQRIFDAILQARAWSSWAYVVTDREQSAAQ